MRATKFFMDNWYQGEKPSRQEALRGTFDPGYLFYTIGKLEILKLRADYQKQEGANFSLENFTTRYWIMVCRRLFYYGNYC